MSTLHIGTAGELLVQYRLVRIGIDSARMTTDSGIDLAAYPPGSRRAFTIQVKAVEKATPAGGKGKPATGFVFARNCPAEYLALVRLSDEQIWLLPFADALRLSKQATPRLYFFVDSATAPPGSLTEHAMGPYLLERQIAELR